MGKKKDPSFWDIITGNDPNKGNKGKAKRGGYEVSKAEAKRTRDGGIETHVYAGPHSLGSPRDRGSEKHAHIVVDESGNVKKARDVGEKRMKRY